MPPDFDECPNFCYKFPKRGFEKSYDFCKTCDVGIAKKQFEESTIKILNERFGNDWKVYGFDNLLLQVKEAFRLKDEKSLSITASIMVDVVKSEQYRQERIERWNRKQRAKNNG